MTPLTFTVSTSGKTLSTCTLAERKVLAAMAALSHQQLLNMVSDDYYNPEYCVDIAQAELDRRREEEPPDGVTAESITT